MWIYVDCPKGCGDEMEFNVQTDSDDTYDTLLVCEDYKQHCKCELSDDDIERAEAQAFKKYE